MKAAALGFILLLVALVAGDGIVARSQSNAMRLRTGSEDFLAALESQIQVGLSREQVELRLAGFREREVVQREDGYTVGYGYWFGVLPPWSKTGTKYVGELVVTYSADDRAQTVSHWYN